MRDDLVLITSSDPDALAREVAARSGRPLAWCRLDAPGVADATVWFSAGAIPEQALALPRLRWIHTGWAGVEGWFGRREWTGAVTLTRTVGDYPQRLAQYVFGYVLAKELDVPEAVRQMEARAWRRWTPGSVAGKGLLVVGHGEIGREVAAVGRSLGMQVEGVRRGAPAKLERARGVRGPAELPACLGRADVVVNLLPLTPETESFWSADRFAAMRDGAIFVNVSRGATVDDAALLRGLKRGRPGFAILDVFREEPLPAAHPLRKNPRVWVTPHIAGIGTPGEMAQAFVENWKRYLAGQPLRFRVDRRRGY